MNGTFLDRSTRGVIVIAAMFAFHALSPVVNAQTVINDFTEYTYSVPAGPIGSFADFPVTRTFDQPIASLKLFIVSGDADDIGYVGSTLVTSIVPMCAGIGSVTSIQEVTNQVTISGNTASFLLRAQENCCCVTGWGSATQAGRANARFQWMVTLADRRIATITATPPIIPRNSTLVNKCVLYRSDLTGVVTKSGQPQQGVALRFRSDRGTPPDEFTQPAQPTDASGTASGNVSTRRQGVAHISADNADVDTPSPAAITFQAADWESQFLMTGYIVAEESDFGGPLVVNPCGLHGTWRHNFLFGNGVLMQGSGQDLNGNIITIDHAKSGHPLNARNVCFTMDSCARGASGVCVQAGISIAVDPTVVPMGASVDIQSVGTRVAQDTGGRINGYHIDIFRGFGRAAMRGFGNFRGTVRYLSGGGQCSK